MRICARIETSSAETGSSQTMKSGPQRDGAGDPDPLALPAREVAGEAVVVLGIEPDQLHQLLHAPDPLGAAGETVDLERVADDRTHPTRGD